MSQFRDYLVGIAGISVFGLLLVVGASVAGPFGFAGVWMGVFGTMIFGGDIRDWFVGQIDQRRNERASRLL